ncbi:hypothetical protein GQ53DRAFT_348286 [Thozetella sp. PMI_491]|nr:hypothetical protein GQ53DRAFT_348286 [Thozetella sp. PMI_491]
MMETPHSLYLLPNELWRQIVEAFSLAPHRLGDRRASEAFRVNREALRQLCSSSRRLAALARPLLYETIIFYRAPPIPGKPSSAASIVYLMRTLMKNHERRRLIRNVAVALSLPSSLIPVTAANQEMAAEWQRHPDWFSELQESDRAILDTVGLAVGAAGPPTGGELTPLETGQFEHIIGYKLVAALLCMTNAAETVLLHNLLTLPSETFELALENLASHPQLRESFLPCLKTLQIQLDPLFMSHGRTIIFGHENPLRAVLSSPLLNQPMLRRMDLWYGWFHALDVAPSVLRAVERIEEMNMMILFRDTASVATLIERAAGLKSLSLTLLPWRGPEPVDEGPGADINEMLLSRSDTLERLSLDTTNVPPEHANEQFGPLGRLTCLPRLTGVQRLAVEPHLLLDWLNANTWPQFLDKLPPNLIKLTLRFVPEHGEDLLRIWARSGVGVALRASRETWERKMPKLRHIHLQPLPFSLRTADMLKEELRDNGIALSWQNEEDVLSLEFKGLSLQ